MKKIRPQTEGARECRATSAPAASCAKRSGKCARVFSAVTPESSGIPARDGFNGCFALSSEIGLSCLRHPRDAKHPRELDASVEATGPCDLTVRKMCALVRSATRVHRIPPRVRDDRDTPLVWDETEADMPVICGKKKQKHFLLWDSTAPITPNLARRAQSFLRRFISSMKAKGFGGFNLRTSLQVEKRMALKNERACSLEGLTLFGPTGSRKYLTVAKRGDS